MRNGQHATYGWIVDIDHEEPGSNRVGIMGPCGIHPDIERALQAGKGRTWRTEHDERGLDPSELLVHQGRYADLHELNLCAEPCGCDAEGEFGPLDDFSRPEGGATMIKYEEAGRWVEL